MFNPEKLLGGMLRSGRRGRGGGLGSLVSGGAALGLVGVAMEAVEHYMNRSQSAPQTSAPSSPPPMPGTTPSTAGGAPPSPPPGQTGAPSAPPPVPPVDEIADRHAGAVLLIRAMITAANADGVIDADERASILGKLKTVDLSKEEHEFIVHELLAPKSVQDLLGEIKTPEMARQVYTASLLAIVVDTEEERNYLRALSQQLNLDDQALDDIHQQLGVPTP